MSEAPAKRNYKKTLNLPATSFPMRANLAENEPKSMSRWEEAGLYARLQEQRADAEAFAFHDGPPYTSGAIHTGHLLNKVLKDIVVRSQLLEGRRCRFIPGWDCHGLPIEHRVMGELVKSGGAKELETQNDDERRMTIRRACEAYASEHLDKQRTQMKRLLTLADYDAPYVTMAPEYEKAVIEVFAEMVAQGVVYRDLKPVHWSIANQTALAEAELEYEERRDPSVFVDFEADDKDAVAAAFGVELDARPSFMIWTTTPWTLPANRAIAVHERFRYALVRVDGNVTVIASELVERVTQAGEAEDVEVLAEADGTALLGLRYRHPLRTETAPVVAADYVTLEDGTGLVHTAPGHGTEDYQTGLREGLEVACPVRADGTYDDSVPEFLRGLSVWDANKAICDHLRESGHLFHFQMIKHQYPLDWRGRTPVIFRATEQWFVGVDRPLARDGKSMRELALDAASNQINFIPEWGRNRMRGMLESRPDWCLSRQRAWGLPIPAFTMADGETFLTPASVRAVADAFGERGSDAWFNDSPAELLATYDAASDPDAPAGLDIASLTKMYDIFDVWFESGSSWNAVMRSRCGTYPSDLYLEGSDQHRGWFQLSLLPALAVTGESPFRSVLTHGFVVTKDGKKMSKSLGNALDVADLLKQFGAEVCRWWVSSLAYEGDVKADMAFMKTASESYRKVRNTLRFLLSNLSDFVPCTDASPDGHCVNLAALDPASLDAWVLEEARTLTRDVRAAYAAYEFRRAHQAIYDFCNDTLSAVYCAATKDRLYCDKADTPRRRATQTVMFDLVEILARLVAPILPHTADEAYHALYGEDAPCIHEKTFVDVPDAPCSGDWPRVFEVRDAVLKALEEAKSRGIENPLDAGLILPDADGVLAPFAADLPDLCGVSRVTLDGSATEIVVEDLSGEPRCERSWKRDGTVSERSDGGLLTDRDAEAIGV